MSRDFEPVDLKFRGIQEYRGLRIRSYRIPAALREASAFEVVSAFMRDDAYNTWFLLDGADVPGGYDIKEGPDADPVADTPRHGPFDLGKLDAGLYAPVPLEEVKEHLRHLTARREGLRIQSLELRRSIEAPHSIEAWEEVERLFSGLSYGRTEALRMTLDPLALSFLHAISLQYEFVEYLVLDRAANVLHMVVVSAA